MRLRTATLIAAPLALVSGAVIGLSTLDGEQPAAAQQEIPTPAAAELDSPRDQFEDIVRREGLTRTADLDTIVDTGYATCFALDGGMTLNEAILTGIRSGLTGSEAGTLVGAAIVALCPRHSDLIPTS